MLHSSLHISIQEICHHTKILSQTMISPDEVRKGQKPQCFFIGDANIPSHWATPTTEAGDGQSTAAHTTLAYSQRTSVAKVRLVTERFYGHCQDDARSRSCRKFWKIPHCMVESLPQVRSMNKKESQMSSNPTRLYSTIKDHNFRILSFPHQWH